jgi:hypothetical protein
MLTVFVASVVDCSYPANGELTKVVWKTGLRTRSSIERSNARSRASMPPSPRRAWMLGRILAFFRAGGGWRVCNVGNAHFDLAISLSAVLRCAS